MTQIETVLIDALIPYARNSRTHSDAQVAQIAASIKEFGFTNPVLIDEDGGIIAGHGRTLAARKLGLDEVPCLRLAYLSEAQKKAYIIADNKLALNAGWDDEMLKVEINELSDLNFDLSLLGFDDVELAKLFDEDEEEEKDLKEESYSEVFNVIVECANESEQEKIFNRLDTEGYKCRVQSL
jgi:ParB-like chromosome segregation protein Spo0J